MLEGHHGGCNVRQPQDKLPALIHVKSTQIVVQKLGEWCLPESEKEMGHGWPGGRTVL